MKSVRMITVLTLAALAFVLLAVAAEVPKEGAPAPAFRLPSQEGKQVSLSDFKGKWVVLYFYPKDFTQGCTIEAKNFETDQPKYTALNAAIVGVSADTVDSHKDFCTKENLTFKTLADPKGDIIDQYGSLRKLEGKAKDTFKQDHIANRNTFLIDPNGVIKKVYVNVNPNAHSSEVLMALAELQKK
jgi:thioredoxin-dependent peroxiredoxin